MTDFLEAAAHAQLCLAVARELFPQSGGYFTLAERQLEIVHAEVANLLVRSKWHLSAAYFDARWTLPAPSTLPAAAARDPKVPQGKAPAHPGQYL